MFHVVNLQDFFLVPLLISVSRCLAIEDDALAGLSVDFSLDKCSRGLGHIPVVELLTHSFSQCFKL